MPLCAASIPWPLCAAGILSSESAAGLRAPHCARGPSRSALWTPGGQALPAHPLKERATLFTVVGVSVLSTLAMIVYPMLASAFGLDARLAALDGVESQIHARGARVIVRDLPLLELGG